jgi:hypothetical protein
MATNKTFREIAIDRAKKQAHIVDAITEEAPIFSAMPMQAASDRLHHNYEKLLDITSATLVDLDGELAQIDMNSKIEQTDLSVIGGTMTVGVDKAKQLGGPARYFDKKIPSIMRQTAAESEQSLIYNNFRQFAIDNGNVIDSSGAANANYSMLVVKWVPEETTGLYDAEGFGNGKVLETIPLSGGNPYKALNSRDQQVTVYGADFKTYFGVLLANERNVSSIVNIDIGTANVPDENDISQAIRNVRGSAGNTFIYVHPTLKGWMGNTFKTSRMRTVVGDKNLNNIVDFWDDIPIVSSYNFFDGTETNV